MGIVMGFFFYTYFSSIRKEVNLDNVIVIILRVIILLQLLDGFAFFGLGKQLVFYPDVFLDKRNYDGSVFFRPTGVFAEANALSLTVLILLGMLDCDWRKRNDIVLPAIMSLALSFSLYGMFSAITLTVVFVLAQRKFLHAAVLGVLGTLCIVYIAQSGLPYVDIFEGRLRNLESDPSADARLGLSHSYGLDIIIPQGFTTSAEGVSRYAANTVLNTGYAMGIFFPLFIFFCYRRAVTLGHFVIISLILVSHSFYTYGLFWAFFGLSHRRAD